MFMIAPIEHLPEWIQEAAQKTARAVGAPVPTHAACFVIYNPTIATGALRNRTHEVRAMLRGLKNDLNAEVSVATQIGGHWARTLYPAKTTLAGAQYAQSICIMAA